jgi:hypothetical protein
MCATAMAMAPMSPVSLALPPIMARASPAWPGGRDSCRCGCSTRMRSAGSRMSSRA